MARGWGGNPPQNDDEARARIIEAAMRCIDRFGPTKTGLSDVATELGVTRQTVYRLYSSTDDLLLAVAGAAADTFLDRLEARTAAITDPVEALVEGIGFAIEQLHEERFLGILLTTGRSTAFLKGVTSEQAVEFSRSMLLRMAVDWNAAGYEGDDLDGLAQFGLRVLQSLIFDPPAVDGPDELRAYVRRWFGPAIVLPAARPTR